MYLIDFLLIIDDKNNNIDINISYLNPNNSILNTPIDFFTPEELNSLFFCEIEKIKYIPQLSLIYILLKPDNPSRIYNSVEVAIAHSNKVFYKDLLDVYDSKTIIITSLKEQVNNIEPIERILFSNKYIYIPFC